MEATTAKIQNLTSLSVRALSDTLAPSCIDCTFARPFVSVDRGMERDDLRVKISVRCDKMTMIGPACPDGGQPGETYLKDLGITRRLGEQQIERSFGIDSFERDMEGALKSSGYIEHIKLAFKEQAHNRDAVLHEMNETLNFVTSGGAHSDEPIAWLKGEATFDTFHKAREVYINNHIQPYRERLNDASLICDPTPYMKKYFPKECQLPFGIMTDHSTESAEKRRLAMEARDSHEGVIFLGDDSPPRSTNYEPPTQDELYEDWGSFA